MISVSQWSQLKILKRSDFKGPDKLEWSIVSALDKLLVSLNSRAVILSDWRDFDPKNPRSQHFKGRAIDFSIPGKNAIELLDKIKSAKLFSGVGIYINEAGGISFHVDTRVEKSVDQPALWGAFITRPGGVRNTAYVAMASVVDFIKKKAPVVAVILLLLGVLWFMRSQGRA